MGTYDAKLSYRNLSLVPCGRSVHYQLNFLESQGLPSLAYSFLTVFSHPTNKLENNFDMINISQSFQQILPKLTSDTSNT